MNRYLKSMAAGFIATIVLSALMVMKSSMGIMPELNPSACSAVWLTP
nr:DUF6789 family protein [Klebsiella pneumoniae]